MISLQRAYIWYMMIFFVMMKKKYRLKRVYKFQGVSLIGKIISLPFLLTQYIKFLYLNYKL